MQQSRHPVSDHVRALGGYLLLSLVVTYPLLGSFTSQVLSEHDPDREQNMWNLWWVKVALLDRHSSPFHTDLLFYPQGVGLYYHTLNLPSTLLTLLPQLAFGVVTAYNASILFALVLSGYAGFRLGLYLTGNHRAALLAGLIIGFNPLVQYMLRGQINLISLQWFVLCIEFYLRGWESGRRRDALLTGLFFVLALLTVGYFEIYLAIFFGVHLLWAVLTGLEPGVGARLRAVGRRARPLLLWGGGPALLIAVPYLLAAATSLQKDRVIAYSYLDVIRTKTHVVDLLSFVLPSRSHWLFGSQAPWWVGRDPNLVDYAYLGVGVTALAVLGVWARRRVAGTWLWVAIAGLGLVLALGAQLEIDGAPAVSGVAIPLPFLVLQTIPLFNLARSPDRFMTLAYVALGVLAGGGITALLARMPPRRQVFALLGVGSLLLLEMPLHPRRLVPLDIPPSLARIGADPAPGALMEFPFTLHTADDAPRMLYQIAHGRPIAGGYLSRPIIDPYTQACAPFQVFARYPNLPAQDIVSPSAATQMPALLADNGVGFLAVYNGEPPELRTAYEGLADRLGTRLAADPLTTVYRVAPTATHTGLYLQLGPDWHEVEQSAGRPFRWIGGDHADFCVFSPVAHSAPLTVQVTSFAAPRHLQIWIGARPILDALVPADGTLHALSIPGLAWPAGPQLVRLVVPEGGTRPVDAGLGADQRQLSLGFAGIRLGAGNP